MGEQVVRQRDAERTRAELLAEATSAFAQSGYSGTKVDDIAQRSSTTKRMIYYYFGSKEQLYLAVLENSYREIREAEQQLRVAVLEPVQALRQIAELTYDHHLEHRDFVRLVAVENIHYGRFVKQVDSLRELNEPALELLNDVLSRGREHALFRDDIDALDVHLLISSYCVFQIANQHTFEYLFDTDIHSPTRRSHLRQMIGDVVVSWATALVK